MSRSRTALALLAGLVLSALAPRAFAADTDGDGLENAFEAAYGTNGGQADTDADGWNDYDEIFVYGTDPTLADTDGDGTNDPSDTAPLHAPSGDRDGNIAMTHSGGPTSDLWAPSGESPQDGVGVYVHNGALVYSASVAGARGVKLPFGFSLVYVSQSSYNGFVGMDWVSMLDLQYTEQGSGDVDMLFPDGITRTWVKSGSNYITPSFHYDDLVKTSTDHFTQTTPLGFQYFWTGGRLASVQDPHGNSISLTWSSGQMTQATDSRGANHTFDYYSATGRLKQINMADGRVWKFEYTETGQLSRITGPTTTTFATGIVWDFRYTNGSTNSSLNDNMIAAIDGKGQSWLEMTYDTSDRVVTQKVGEADFEFDYTNIGSQSMQVTDRAGNERIWQWNSTTLARSQLDQNSNRNVRTSDPTSWTTAWTHDSDGFLATVTYPEGNGVKYTRNSVKLVSERRRKADMGVADSWTNDLIETWAYDSSKNYGTTSYIDPEGHETTYTLDSVGRPTTITYETITHTTPNVTVQESIAYNGDGTVDTRTDGEGKVTKFDYYTTPTAKLGRVHYKTVDYGTGTLNLQTTYDYTDWGDVKQVIDPEGDQTDYTVEAYGNVTQVTGPSALGYITKYTHDGNLNVTVRQVKNIDENGTALTTPSYWRTEYTYTVMDKLTQLKEWKSTSTTRVTSLFYDDNDNLYQRTIDNKLVEMTYDERDMLYLRVRDPGTSPAINATETFTYDDNGNLVTYSDPRSKTTTFEYDGFDRRTKTINALGDYEVTVYCKDGMVAERLSYEEAGATDTLVAHTKITCDELHRHWKYEYALLGSTTTWESELFEFDNRGLVTKATSRRGNDVVFAYDGAGRRTSATDDVGNVTSWEYDDDGNVTAVDESEVVPGSSNQTFRTEFEYDAVDRKTKQTVIDRTNSSNTKVTEWKWNSRNVVAKTIDPLGWTTTCEHDGLGRRTKERRMTDGSGGEIVTTWTFDDNDMVTVMEDDNGNETTYAYDKLNRLTTKTYEDATTATYSYDAAGNVLEMIDRAGNEIDQGFSDINQLTARDITLATGFGGDTDEDFAYDALGRLTQASDDDSIVQFTYDSLGRVLTETQGSNPLGTTGKTVTYTLDAEGNQTEIDYPSGFEAHRTFDELNRLTLLEDSSSNDIASWTRYGAANRRDVLSYENGTTTTWGWDGFRRPTTITHEDSGSSEFAGFTYGWDKNDNPTFEARSHQSGKGDVYSYDRANRLTKVLQDVDDPANEVANPGAESYVDKVEYNMDDVLNFTSLVTTPYGGSASTVSYSTNAMNEYTSVGGTSHTYDDNGNLVDDGTYEYVYDGHNHLIEVIDPSGPTTIATYTYDALGLGRRSSKTVGSDTTRFVYANQQCLEEYDGSGNLLRLFAFGQGIDEVAMMEAPDVADVDGDLNTTETKRFYYHTQLLGSVTQLTDPDEVVVESYDYGPYGEITIKDIGGSTVSTSQIGNPFTYTGRRLDEESGLYYYRARHYSAELKRFIQRDPLEYVDGANAHMYAQAGPILRSDPSGQDDRAALDAAQKIANAIDESATPPPSVLVPWTQAPVGWGQTIVRSNPEKGKPGIVSVTIGIQGMDGIAPACVCGSGAKMAGLIATLRHEDKHYDKAEAAGFKPFSSAMQDPEHADAHDDSADELDQLVLELTSPWTWIDGVSEHGDVLCPCGCRESWNTFAGDMRNESAQERDRARHYRNPSGPIGPK